MKKFKISIPYWTIVVCSVEAENEDEAIEKALILSNKGQEDEEINIGIDDSKDIDVEEIKQR